MKTISFALSALLFLTTLQPIYAQTTYCGPNSYLDANLVCKLVKIDNEWNSIEGEIKYSTSDSKGNTYLYFHNKSNKTFQLYTFDLQDKKTLLFNEPEVLNKELIDLAVSDSGDIYLLFSLNNSLIIEKISGQTKTKFYEGSGSNPSKLTISSTALFLSTPNQTGFSIYKLNLNNFTNAEEIYTTTHTITDIHVDIETNLLYIIQSQLIGNEHRSDIFVLDNTVAKRIFTFPTNGKAQNIQVDSENNFYTSFDGTVKSVFKVAINYLQYRTEVNSIEYEGFEKAFILPNQLPLMIKSSPTSGSNSSFTVTVAQIKPNNDIQLIADSVVVKSSNGTSPTQQATTNGNGNIFIPSQNGENTIVANLNLSNIPGSEVSKYTVHRFFHKARQVHFYSANPEEVNYVRLNNPNWTYEGPAFDAYEFDTTKEICEGISKPVYRFWSNSMQVHFYTIDEAEKNYVIQTNPNWKYESIAFCALSADTISNGKLVYRFWSNERKSHFYTTSIQERDMVQKDIPDYIFEGGVFVVK